MAGKGDDYRPVDKKKFDSNFDKIFGEKDPVDYQKGKKYFSKNKESKNEIRTK